MFNTKQRLVVESCSFDLFILFINSDGWELYVHEKLEETKISQMIVKSSVIKCKNLWQ